MMTEGVTLGPTAVNQIRKLVQQEQQRIRNRTQPPTRGRWSKKGGKGGSAEIPDLLFFRYRCEQGRLREWYYITRSDGVSGPYDPDVDPPPAAIPDLPSP